MNTLRSLDQAVLLFFNQPAGRIPLLDKLVYHISDSLLLKGGIFLALYWALWFRRSDRVEDERRDIATGVICAVVIVLASRLLQIGLPFHRRPLHTPDLGFRLPFEVNPDKLNDWSSFPSDHAVLFFALCVPLWMRSRWLGLAMGGWTLVVICLPRVYLGYHFPSDVLAGAVIGIVLMLVLHKALAPTSFPDRLVALEKRSPHLFYAAAFLVTLELAFLFSDVRNIGQDAIRLLKALASPAIP